MPSSPAHRPSPFRLFLTLAVVCLCQICSSVVLAFRPALHSVNGLSRSGAVLGREKRQRQHPVLLHGRNGVVLMSFSTETEKDVTPEEAAEFQRKVSWENPIDPPVKQEIKQQVQGKLRQLKESGLYDQLYNQTAVDQMNVYKGPYDSDNILKNLYTEVTERIEWPSFGRQAELLIKFFIFCFVVILFSLATELLAQYFLKAVGDFPDVDPWTWLIKGPTWRSGGNPLGRYFFLPTQEAQ
ncbi:unnamed protein product [Vitrella brassicaformis CCMP3155]|uniref:Uncharacterized protein n=1 Tax=Vitrella brassicaformis (strain CCMP3155) TaxID=1169540 RepID=A0A0G4H183_VITBC|nr:unnamed protein product [Vitrella brassicaformis CCMP3155]|eukprot:CEM37317.1 unnamed protein product [Vitrella brassicaformis CCMP3155]